MFFGLLTCMEVAQKKITIHFHTKQHDKQQEKVSTLVMKILLTLHFPPPKKISAILILHNHDFSCYLAEK